MLESISILNEESLMTENELQEKLNSTDPKIHLAFEKSIKQWVWVGYVGMGMYDYSVIRDPALLKHISEMVESGKLIIAESGGPQVQGALLEHYLLSN